MIDNIRSEGSLVTSVQAHVPATPVRTCLGCRRRDTQPHLLRVVRIDSGRLHVDLRRRMPGRGAWLHPSPACLALALRRRSFARSFRGEVDATGLDAEFAAYEEAVSARKQPESGSDT